MRLSLLTTPKPLEAAVGACRRGFALAAGLSGLLDILHFAPTIDTMQVDDRAAPTGGVQTLLWVGTTHGAETTRWVTGQGIQP